MNADVHIQTALRGSMTFLKSCYCTPPFKVMNITEDKHNKPLQLMLMNASPGVLDGDSYTINIEVASGCSLQLFTQSYQRLFQMKKGASQQVKIHLDAGASFSFLPHPTVPHQASSFTAVNKIFLAKDCRLIWGEVLTCGRNLHGEHFTFSKYHSVTEIFLKNRLVIRENLLLQPSLLDLAAIGQLEGYTHQATFIYLQENISIPNLMQRLHDWLLLQEAICFGITALPVNGLLVRMLGYKGEQLHHCLQQLAAQLPPAAVAPSITPKTAVYAN